MIPFQFHGKTCIGQEETLMSKPKQREQSQRAIEEAFPSLARWVQGYGWIEIGRQEQFGFVARAFDDGGLIFEDNRCPSLADAMLSLEAAISAWFKEHETAQP